MITKKQVAAPVNGGILSLNQGQGYLCYDLFIAVED